MDKVNIKKYKEAMKIVESYQKKYSKIDDKYNKMKDVTELDKNINGYKETLERFDPYLVKELRKKYIDNKEPIPGEGFNGKGEEDYNFIINILKHIDEIEKQKQKNISDNDKKREKYRTVKLDSGREVDKEQAVRIEKNDIETEARKELYSTKNQIESEMKNSQARNDELSKKVIDLKNERVEIWNKRFSLVPGLKGSDGYDDRIALMAEYNDRLSSIDDEIKTAEKEQTEISSEHKKLNNIYKGYDDVLSLSYENFKRLLEGKEIVKESTKSEPTKSEPTKPEPTKSEPTKPEPTKPEPTKPEPTKPEPTKAVAKQNPFRSLLGRMKQWFSEKISKLSKNKTEKVKELGEYDKKKEFKDDVKVDFKELESKTNEQLSQAIKQINSEIRISKKNGNFDDLKRSLAQMTTSDFQFEYDIDYTAAAKIAEQTKISQWRKEFRKESLQNIFELPKDSNGEVVSYEIDNETDINPEQIDGLSRMSIEKLQRECFLTKAEATQIYSNEQVAKARSENKEQEQPEDGR